MPGVTQLAEGRPKDRPAFSDFQTGVFPRAALPPTVGARLPLLPVLLQGKEKFLGILNKYMEIHGTVYYESQRPPEVPAFVKNHGLLPQPEFQQLLRKAKVSPAPSPSSPSLVPDAKEVALCAPPPRQCLPLRLVAPSTGRPAPACSPTLSLTPSPPGAGADLELLTQEGPGQGQQSRGSAVGKRKRAARWTPGPGPAFRTAEGLAGPAEGVSHLELHGAASSASGRPPRCSWSCSSGHGGA